MVVLKKVKETFVCNECSLEHGKNYGLCSDNICYTEGIIYKKLNVKNVVIIDGIAYKEIKGSCIDCDMDANICLDVPCHGYIYKKLGKVVQHVNNNK